MTSSLSEDSQSWLLACLTSQQHASGSQGRICSYSCTCCQTEIEVADQTFHLTLSQYTDIGPTSPSADPVTPVAWQGSHWSASFEVTGMTRPRKIPDSNPGSSSLDADALTTRPSRLSTARDMTALSAEGEEQRREDPVRVSALKFSL